MPKTKLILLFLSGLFLALPCFAEESYTLDKIIVRANNSLSADPAQIINSNEIKEKNLNTLADLLGYVSGMDLRYRGTFGIQGDLSLRGSTYEQVAVLVDGVRINDSQTGHHNLDIPLTTFDVERVEVTKDGNSSLYGSGALAGSVNIVTKKPLKKSLNIDTLFGENALFGQTASLSLPAEGAGLPWKSFSARVSFDHKISKAARPNTDFEYKTASLYLDKSLDRVSLDALFGYQKKDFGADSFYSNNFPEEEEHTEPLFFKGGINPKLDCGSFQNDIYFRKHRDKFILKRNNPTSVNYHTTYLYGLNSRLTIPIKFADIILGLDLGEDQINSTNLGKHNRAHESGSIGLTPKLTDKLGADLRFRLDNYQKWGSEESYNLSLGYELIDDKLKIKGSLAHAFRLPSFTELYYFDAANQGNANLKQEKSDTFSTGLEFKENKIRLGLGYFLRQGHNLIDWTRRATSDPWVATNLGRVDFWGIEFSSQLEPKLDFKGFNLEKIIFSYNYMEADKKESGFFSKYALDILKQQYLLDLYSRIIGLNFNWQLSYNQRYYGETYFVGNIYLAKRIKIKDCYLEPFVRIDNFTNTKYSEITDVLLPGRWIKSGVKFEW